MKKESDVEGEKPVISASSSQELGGISLDGENYVRKRDKCQKFRSK